MGDPVALLFNPAAGGGRRARAVLAAFTRVFGRNAPTFTTPATRDEDEALTLALRALPPATVLCIAGGDGTLHDAVQVVARACTGRTWFTLALVPIGSANDGARALAELTGRAHGRDVERELVDVARRVEAGHRGESADVGVALVPGGGRRLFVNFAAAGSPADWAALSSSPPVAIIKRFHVGLAYQLCNLGVIARRRVHALQVGLDEAAPQPCPAFAWFAARARYLGGGLDLGGDVRLDSGRLHVLALGPASRLSLVRLLGAARRGRGPRTTPVASADLVLPAPARLNLDGELWPIDAGSARVRLGVLRACARWL